MSRKPIPETGKVPVVLAASVLIEGKARFAGETIYQTPQGAEELKMLRMARDLSPDELARQGYARRDMQPTGDGTVRDGYARRDVRAG
jgi:hypothetical protein